MAQAAKPSARRPGAEAQEAIQASGNLGQGRYCRRTGYAAYPAGRVEGSSRRSFPPGSVPSSSTHSAKLIAVRCPAEFNDVMRWAGGQWEPGCWLIERRRISSVIRALRRQTDPLFRQVGIDLDGEG